MTGFTAEREVAVYNINGYKVGEALLYGGRVTRNLTIQDNLNLTSELLVQNQNGDLVPYCIIRQDGLKNVFYYSNNVLATNEIYKYKSDGHIQAYYNLEDNPYVDGLPYSTFYSGNKEYNFLTLSSYTDGLLIENSPEVKLGKTTVKDFEELISHKSHDGHTDMQEENTSLETTENGIFAGMENDDFFAIIVDVTGVLYNANKRQFIRLDTTNNTYKIISIDEARNLLGVKELYVIDKHAILTKGLDSLKSDSVNLSMYTATTLKSLPTTSSSMVNSLLFTCVFILILLIPIVVQYRLNKFVLKFDDDNSTINEASNDEDNSDD